MKLVTIVLFILSSATALAAGTNQLITSGKYLAEPISEHSLGAKFDLSATVLINRRKPQGLLLAQDGETIFTIHDHSTNDLSTIRPGDRIHATGKINPGMGGGTAADFNEIRLLSHGSLPQPSPESIHDLLQDQEPTFRFVTVEGTVIDAFPDEIDVNWGCLILGEKTDTLFLFPYLHDRHCDLGTFIGKRVRATGVYRPTTGVRQMIGKSLELDSLESLQIIADGTEHQLDISDINSYTCFSRKSISEQSRCFAIGTVIATWGGNMLLLRESSGRIIRGELNGSSPPAYGKTIRLIGFPETDLYSVILVRAEWAEIPTEPQEENITTEVSVRQIQTVKQNVLRYDMTLHGKTIRIKGPILGMPIKGGIGMLYVENDGQMVPVDVSSVPNAVRDVDVGFTVEVTGTCVIETEKMSLNRTFPRINGYRIVVRTPDDIQIISHPSWWTASRLFGVIGLLLAVLLGIILWNVILRRAVTRRGKELETEITARIESDLKVYERTRLAVELHDSIAQNLTGATMEIRTADILADSDSTAMHKYLSLARKTLDSCREDLRNCIWDLRNLTLDEASVDEAIHKTLEPHTAGVDLQIRFNIPRERLTDNTTHAILRIIRELVLNAIRHGKATHIKIAGSVENDKLLFSVKDNGCGFDPGNVPGMGEGHFGLQGIRDRIRNFGGDIKIASKPEYGTKVTISLHIPTSNEGTNA